MPDDTLWRSARALLTINGRLLGYGLLAAEAQRRGTWIVEWSGCPIGWCMGHYSDHGRAPKGPSLRLHDHTILQSQTCSTAVKSCPRNHCCRTPINPLPLQLLSSPVHPCRQGRSSRFRSVSTGFAPPRCAPSPGSALHAAHRPSTEKVRCHKRPCSSRSHVPRPVVVVGLGTQSEIAIPRRTRFAQPDDTRKKRRPPCPPRSALRPCMARRAVSVARRARCTWVGRVGVG